MNFLNKLKKMTVLCLNVRVLTCPTRYLFLLSHMRSRSSLLAHIIGSNPQVRGYSELHQSYSNKRDLLAMRAKIFLDLKRPLDHCYLFDKVLHNTYGIADDIIETYEPRFILLLRKPEDTLSSIMRLGQLTQVRWYSDPRRIADYYCARLAALNSYAEKLTGKFFFIDSDDLIDYSYDVLANLSTWLGLEKPLSGDYSIFTRTGLSGSGDPSEKIKTGIIQRQADYNPMRLPLDCLQKSQAAYEKHRTHILEHCVANNENTSSFSV